MSFEGRRSDFARDRLEFFDRGLENFLDAVQLLFDLGVVVSSDQHYSVKQLRLGERIFPVRLIRTRLDRVADAAGARSRANSVRFHAVCEIVVRRVSDVFGEDSSHLIRWLVVLIGSDVRCEY